MYAYKMFTFITYWNKNTAKSKDVFYRISEYEMVDELRVIAETAITVWL